MNDSDVRNIAIMKKFILTTITSFLFLAVAALTSHAQRVSGSIAQTSAGGSARGTITLSVPGGLHVNSRNPNSRYAIPTTVTLSAKGVKVSAVVYPRGVNRKFQFSEDTLNVYEGRTSFRFNVTVPANFKGSTYTVVATVRYQACTDEVCYSPTSKKVTLTGRVR
jgi:hypothetical protein